MAAWADVRRKPTGSRLVTRDLRLTTSVVSRLAQPRDRARYDRGRIGDHFVGDDRTAVFMFRAVGHHRGDDAELTAGAERNRIDGRRQSAGRHPETPRVRPATEGDRDRLAGADYAGVSQHCDSGIDGFEVVRRVDMRGRQMSDRFTLVNPRFAATVAPARRMRRIGEK